MWFSNQLGCTNEWVFQIWHHDNWATSNTNRSNGHQLLYGNKGRIWWITRCPVSEVHNDIRGSRIHVLTQSGKWVHLISATKSVSYYMRRLNTSTMMVAHVEFNHHMSNIHIQRLYISLGMLIFINDNRNESLCQLHLTISSRQEVSNMNSQSELRLSSTVIILQRISHQLLPPPYVTMCSHDITTRVTCLDHCLQLTFNNDGRLIAFINSTLVKGTDTDNRLSLIRRCQTHCARRPCTGSVFGSTTYEYKYNSSLIGMSFTEQQLIVSPKMSFEDLLINLLQVMGIWIGLSISDCITSLINGLIWLNNQRIR